MSRSKLDASVLEDWLEAWKNESTSTSFGPGQNGLCCRNARECGAFHEALPFIERVGVFAGKQEIADWKAFQTCHRRELAWTVTGIAAFHQRIRRPMFEMDQIPPVYDCGCVPCAWVEVIEILQKLLRLTLGCGWVEPSATLAARIVDQNSSCLGA